MTLVSACMTVDITVNAAYMLVTDRPRMVSVQLQKYSAEQ